jgi:small conductance mechanosensitive channel
MAGMPVPVATDCTNSHAGPINGLCNLVDPGSHPVLEGLLGRVAWPIFVLLTVLVFSRIARHLVMSALERTQADAQVRTLIKNIMVVVGWLLAVFGAFYAVGVDLTIFLTVGGLGTLVVGLAFQDLLRNVLAGMFLLLEKPFRIGDVITIGDLTGSVVTIQLRTTAIKLPDGQLAVVPNLSAFNQTVINVTAFEHRRFSVNLWVPIGTDLEVLLPALREQLRSPEIATEPAPRIQPTVDIDGGVTLQCQFWLDARAHDADGVQALLVRRLYATAERIAGREVTAPTEETATPPAAEPEPDGEARPARRRRLRIPKVSAAD